MAVGSPMECGQEIQYNIQCLGLHVYPSQPFCELGPELAPDPRTQERADGKEWTDWRRRRRGWDPHQPHTDPVKSPVPWLVSIEGKVLRKHMCPIYRDERQKTRKPLTWKNRGL